MSSKAYIIPTDSLTFQQQQEYRVNALCAGIARCFGPNSIAVWDPGEFGQPSQINGVPTLASIKAFLLSGGWPKSLDVREFQPILDAGAALDQWNTAALAAVGTEYSIFQAVAAPAAALRVKKLVVWYKVSIDTIPVPISRLVFRRNAAAGLLQSEFDIEQLVNQIRLDGYFSEPVIWDNNTAYAINAMARIATGVLARVIMGNLLFEPAGTTNV